MGGPHDLAHGVGVVSEVGFGEAVDNVGAMVSHHVGQVGLNMAKGTGAEVANASLQGHIWADGIILSGP